MGLSLATAERWVERWERQQQRYAVDREERFTVIADVVEHIIAAGAHRPLIADLGCGPGSLAARLARRLPDADIVAVDRDPLLLELARTHHADAARYVDAVIGAPGWTEALGLDRPLDAAVSTTALHYLGPDVLSRAYRELAALLRPGGILVNGDHLPQDDAALAAIARCAGRRRAERQRAYAHEDWVSWWTAVAEDPELADLLAERHARQPVTGAEGAAGLPLSAHVRLLREAGFRHAGPVWQYGDSHVVVAIR
ncbi:trans-aconitate methyltransferase [Streptomyces griseochromogenes]|uniref:Methyltransferase n=1 Tax=Streptomyces griseochromogenes TaxID=68214 RepID=A0A1B1B121_9ACTN|nr:class I SAM-dependent methyltransferase [Streptomyces griseochromogenes]ANP52528.1 methyltransferase [Streptomyces griseochromogenes]MBP2047088.1 trans-aconitate methyltransferase [Streptomyces griseochromogenes]